jgi:hypothetical protein
MVFPGHGTSPLKACPLARGSVGRRRPPSLRRMDVSAITAPPGLPGPRHAPAT